MRHGDTLHDLIRRFAQHGELVWIGLRPAHRAPIRSVSQALLLAGRGLEGDRAAERQGGRRQVTLIQAEYLPVIASLCGRAEVVPELLRRNLVVRGISLNALSGCRFRIGEAVLEYTGPCAPCSRMEEVLGLGGYNALRGHGGITARVITGAGVKCGDQVGFVHKENESSGQNQLF